MAKLKKKSTPAARLVWLLDHVWDGSQHAMAKELGITQAAISLIKSGKNGVGPRLLATLAACPRLNPQWVREGRGDPLAFPPQVKVIAAPAFPVLMDLVDALPAVIPEGAEYIALDPAIAGAGARKYWYRHRAGEPNTSQLPPPPGGGDRAGVPVTMHLPPGEIVLIDLDLEPWKKRQRINLDAYVVHRLSNDPTRSGIRRLGAVGGNAQGREGARFPYVHPVVRGFVRDISKPASNSKIAQPSSLDKRWSKVVGVVSLWMDYRLPAEQVASTTSAKKLNS